MKNWYLKTLCKKDFEARRNALLTMLASCTLCPRHCNVNRLKNEKGYCATGRLPVIRHAVLHQGEEPPISGTNGSGTVFFSYCNMRCVFCQNWHISHEGLGDEISIDALAALFLNLQNQGAHNINLVSPTHVVPQIIEALGIAYTQGLSIPLVYNSNGFDEPTVIQLLNGIIDIYLPDWKYSSSKTAEDFSDAPHYVDYARQALLCMVRQVGPLSIDKRGLAQRGLLIRHLILPNHITESIECLRQIKKYISTDVPISLMSQYHPCHTAENYPALARCLTQTEYQMVLDEALTLSFEHIFTQELDAASCYLPDFKKEKPFEETQ